MQVFKQRAQPLLNILYIDTVHLSIKMGPGLIYLSAPNKAKNSARGNAGGIEFVATEMQGWRKYMEDANCVIPRFGGDPTAALFGVFDGHGGIPLF